MGRRFYRCTGWLLYSGWAGIVELEVTETDEYVRAQMWQHGRLLYTVEIRKDSGKGIAVVPINTELAQFSTETDDDDMVNWLLDVTQWIVDTGHVLVEEDCTTEPEELEPGSG